MSDSLLFRSATTTKEDTIIAKELQKITWIESLEDFAMPMFNAKSDLWDMEIEKLIKYDYKEFDLNWTKAWIWTLETTNPGYWLGRKEEILKWLEKIKIQDNLDFIMLSIVDIIWEKNTTIALEWNDSKVIEEVFNCKVENNQANLKNRLSRKKQVVPDLTEYFNK
jgi:manganese-dependent inorganic pyrophosphatase